MSGENPAALEFAARLREVKDRSGLSFGTLAKRLHTSTSTLHRYCVGSVVPADYAPVERLARACGASGSELLELHRLWLRADALRPTARQATTASAAGTAAASAEVTDLAARAPAGGAGHVRPGGADAAPGGPGLPAGAAAAAASGPAGPGGGGTPAGPGGVGPGEPAGGPGLAAGEVGVGAGPAGAVAPDGGSGGPVAAVDVTGPAARAPAGGAGHVRPGGAAAAPGPAGLRPARRWWGGRLPALLGGCAALVVVAVTAVTVAAARDDEPVPPAPPGAPTEPTPEPVPLSWETRSHVWAGGCGHRYLVDRDPAAVPAPPVAQDAERWAAELGAVHGGSTIVESTLRAGGPEPVVVEAVHVRVVERRPPLDWPAFDMELGCGGALTPAAFTADLDVDRPVARPRDGFDGMSGDELPAPEPPFLVGEGEPLVLRVEAATVDCDCDWYVELDWTSGADSGLARIDDDGLPFRTSGVPGPVDDVYAHPAGRWEPGHVG
ncbi:helix-turn-helix domain-containing protein [Streptomyces hainanensis]|uniref:XRE family transcriptional regulator n=1 Tax=Streptomyces hainanensis TaxID=402648 RepID=A0A4R4T9D0_9ACTN|nr:helix-turn-helix transcriptional regulator [Streptomyces hainanensis]TDC73710.1 XRE family transcriptional regulator [Streptomyces hainanensis]